MADNKYPKSNLPIRQTADLLPRLFQTEANTKFLAGTLDPLVQPGVLEKTVGYIGRRYGKTYNVNDIYLDTDDTLRSRYQLEPGVVVNNDNDVDAFYDYIDFKNQLKFFNNNIERDDLITAQDHYTWNPPIDWDKFVNYREYFWVPEGPPPVRIFGVPLGITSTYNVTQSTTSSWIFSPDGLTNNPTLTLYKGYTYKFKINSPGEGFFIRRSLDTGSLLYNPILPYSANQVVVYAGKIYRALVDVSSQAEVIPLDQDSRWRFIDTTSEQNSYIDYDSGVSNNGTENGVITFDVPYDSPDILYYQSVIDPNRFGKFIIRPVEENTAIDVNTEILGKETFTSNNGISFTNGLIIEFTGIVTPSEYSTDTWLVEGVGTEISLTRFKDLVIPETLSLTPPDILFDNEGFDSLPFDDASSYPANKDYLTISKSSKDKNPWSRYNRWFHRSVLELSHQLNDSSFASPESSRAKRPIIEFKSNLQLFNHGSDSKQSIDFIDTFTTDVFSTIEGSKGFIVDGEQLFAGARILITNDTDSLVNNKIFQVTFIVHNGRKQISLIDAPDSDPITGHGVLVRKGTNNKGLMYYFNGTSWIKSQLKTSVNQPPLFDVFDETGTSFSDKEYYPVNNFIGSEITSYKIGNGVIDKELGFAISYLNINNIGDIQFESDLETGSFSYQLDQTVVTVPTAVGYYKFSDTDNYENGWAKLDINFIQPIIDSVFIDNETDTILSRTIYWDRISEEDIKKIVVFVNGYQIRDEYSRQGNTFTFSRTFNVGDTVTFKIFADAEPDIGYYEIPLGLEKNPLNQNIENFTLGQAADHISTGIELVDDFSGVYPGQNNLRDLSRYEKLTRRFLKHSGITPLSIVLLCDKEINIIKSLQYAKSAYTEFKNVFLNLSTMLPFVENTADFVDSILSEMSNSKNDSNAFFESDMIGSGAYTESVYKIDDEGIKTYVLAEKFDLDSISNRAVYLYRNDQQLLNHRDYEFNSNFGFVTLTIELTEGDIISIREYTSTANNFIPTTPTKLGLYKKYTPSKFLDDTYQEPRSVIQGHDGSLITAFNDFRDDLLLELEYRIYNNIKQKYDSLLFDNDKILGGYYGSATYDKQQLDSVLSEDFLRWVSKINIDYINNDFFDSENSFTFTYSNMTDPTGTENLPGYWRGVYRWFYDTDRPHRCPWEMLGFSEMPYWWETEYGPAPYTRNNLILWEDLSNGIIRYGDRAGIHDRYKRSSLLDHIPTDSNGTLLSPLDSGLAGNFVLVNNQGTFNFGDVSPVEHAWRSSSEYPFSLVSALILLKPFDYISNNFNRSNTIVNRVDQRVNAVSKKITTLSDIAVFDQLAFSGLAIYVKDYVKGKTLSVSSISNKLQNIDVRISSRLSGFVDKQQQKYILDSKSPSSTSSNIFIPQENYNIIFEVSNPISSVTYSGIIIEKVNNGWKLSGYDSSSPYFRYFQAVPGQSDPLISIGGISETFLNWESNKFYGNGVLVRYNNKFYRSLRSHTGSDTFDTALWKQVPKVPIVGATEALLRRQFNKLNSKVLNYGKVLSSIQDVVDFFLGYEEYQKFQGFAFNGYNSETQTSYNWLTSAKEFMYWSKHNWAIGSLISLSPCAESIEIFASVGVVDNLLDSFYEYQVYKNDGTPINPKFINVSREFQKTKISTANTTDGIYFLKMYYVLKEHVVLFDDRTVFNDVIYDKPTGYRQDRIKVRGFRTVDWDGDYTSPGFLFDNVKIDSWQPFIDYRLGDIVAYKSFYWTGRFNHTGTDEFNNSNWTKLDLIPKKGLVSNFDYRINQFEDYYEVTSDGVGSSQRDLARHAIGYQQREYLQNLAEDDVTQFKLYQGFIREKGTSNSVVKVFDKLSQLADDSVVLNEEWAFKVGEFGGVDQTREIEFRLYKEDFKLNPQPILLQSSEGARVILDQYSRTYKKDFTIAPIPFTTEVNPVSDYEGLTRNSGYVNSDQVKFTVSSREAITEISILLVRNNDHFWITFDSNSWTVLRYNITPELRISNVEIDSDVATITINQPHGLSEGDVVGIISLENLEGFYSTFDVSERTFSVIIPSGQGIPVLDENSISYLGILTEVRFKDYSEIDVSVIPLLENGSKLWIDSNGTEEWKVVEKTSQYAVSEIDIYGVDNPIGVGKSVVYLEKKAQTITSAPNLGYLLIYKDTSSTGDLDKSLKLTQIVPQQPGFENSTINVFAETLAASPDEQWIVAGSPRASGVKSKYKGQYDSVLEYLSGDIVLDDTGKLWEAVRNISAGDGSTILLGQEDWQPVSSIEANTNATASNLSNQGMITLYKYESSQWIIHSSLVSPRPTENELFGSAISIGVSGSKYYMAVSAVGSLSNTGRVYIFYYDGTNWVGLENNNYLGVFDLSRTYPANSVVWYNNKIWKTLVEVLPGSDPESSNDWIEDIENNTQNVLPSNPAVIDNNSILDEGLLGQSQLVELVESGDSFGFNIAMNRDASILAVGVPNSGGKFYLEFKGVWDSYQTYLESNVVKHLGVYYELTAETSKNDIPSAGAPWSMASTNSIKERSGKVFIYRKDETDRYVLIQSIIGSSLSEVSDTEIENLDSGDYFGYSLDLDGSGETLVVSAPQADINFQDQGSVFVFKLNTLTFNYSLTQRLDSFENNVNEMFGSSVSISSGTEQIAVGAKNSSYEILTIFDEGTTVFENNTTVFFEFVSSAGQVYVFENISSTYYLTEKLRTGLPNESFGANIDASRDSIAVSSPNYTRVNELTLGTVRLYRKKANSSSLQTIESYKPLVDISLIDSVILYDDSLNVKIADLDIIDNYKLKILGRAEQEISFKTLYDPAFYSNATSDQIVDPDQAWLDLNVGKLWWDLSTVKFLYYEQDDTDYKIGNWNSQVVGSNIDIYEWVETPLLPSEWSVLADTVEGLNLRISGQPKFPNDTVYNVKIKYNPQTGVENGTLYYYWVKNSSIIPLNNNQRKISSVSVTELISNPSSSGLPFVAVIDKDKFLAFNLKEYFESDTALINIRYKNTVGKINNVHSEYQLLTEGVADSLPSNSLETKWIDSLIGADQSGNRVPDLNLPAKQQYGINYRPRQTMFVDRFKALKIVIENVNTILKTQPFTELINFTILNSKDLPPDELLNQYDVAVDNYIDLETVGTVRTKQAILSPNIVNGAIDTIDIIDPGFGYRVTPPIVIDGTGANATAVATIDNQGRVISVTVTRKGRKYSSAVIKIRPFAVLVVTDSTSNNDWGIYSWDDKRRTFYKSMSQSYDVTQYWEYTDWWKDNYSNLSRIVIEIDNLYQEPTLTLEVGGLLRIKEFANGGWAVLEKTESDQGDILNNYILVGRQLGTIQLKDTTYNISKIGIGYNGSVSYDSVFYDLQNAKELRLILTSVKEDIFTDNLRVEWNKLFFTSIRYAFSEQLYIDWAFKTSFLSAIHNVGELSLKVNYKNDNLDSYRAYLEEVKPFRTTIREYTSRYTRLENTPTSVTDFDLPPAYSIVDGQILPITEYFNKTAEYPWKWWADNNGYSISSIEIYDNGSDYVSVPEVVISGNGSGATARAFISNGKVVSIKIVSEGIGYTQTPIVTIVGGNGNSLNQAKAVAILGNSLIRTFKSVIKFDRISKQGLYQNFIQTQEFTATGSSAVFDLDYAPNLDKTKISITKNNQIILNNEFEIEIYQVTVDDRLEAKGRLLFNTLPELGEEILIVYEKSDLYYDSVNRIEKFYSPVAGMIGKELPQLMTGIDFGGVQIQGNTFDITGGWDALPWAVDNWDAVESSSDFYYVFAAPDFEEDLIYKPGSSITFDNKIYILQGSEPSDVNDIPGTPGSSWEIVVLDTVELPFIPDDGQLISIYLKRNGELRAARIDDQYYDQYDGSTVLPNGRTTAPQYVMMPSFIGDGSTKIVSFENYVTVDSGDTLIFRTIDSDGSVVINDVNLLDTIISGGSYATAQGIKAEEIVIDGDSFISPDQVPAPEENVPGQVLESVSIKVFNATLSSATPIHTTVFMGNDTTVNFDIGLKVFEESSILVYVNKLKQEPGIDYNVNFFTNQLAFLIPPVTGSSIEVISIGIGGTALIDYQEFLADGDTILFLTNAVYQQTGAVAVSVDGEFVDVNFINSSEVIDTTDRTMIQFGIAPTLNQRIKIICLGVSSTNESVDLSNLIRVNEQKIIFDGSTYTYELDNFVKLPSASAQSAILVDINDIQLSNVDTIYQVYDGTNSTILLGSDPEELPGAITTENITVYVNNILKTFISDYTFSTSIKTITMVEEKLKIGDQIRIEVDLRSEYTINDNQLSISPLIDVNVGDVISVVWFDNYPEMNLISDQHTGGKIIYKLARTPLSSDYVWIYKNGEKLTKNIDYSVSVPSGIVELKDETIPSDIIKIIEFASEIYRAPCAYEIFKDMLNTYHYKRYSKDDAIRLAKDLKYYDLTLEVSDATTLFEPIQSRNIPGVVIINEERIEYLTKNGNILGNLRRGSLGTAIAEVHSTDSYVINSSPSETIPYREVQEQSDFISDGSSSIIGPLDFIPTKSNRGPWFKNSIPEGYGPNDEVEVFVGGRRLRKDPISVYDEASGPINSDSVIELEAEFSVDGTSKFIRLTESVPLGIRISVIRKQGRTWYDQGMSTASSGVTFLQNKNEIIEFILQKGSELPE
jgi:hypothetical protein